MNLGDIKTRVYRTFSDESQVQITSADIVRWVNDGQRKIILEDESVLDTTGTANSVTAQTDYALPADFQVLRSVKYKRLGQNSFYKLKYLSMQELDELEDGWDGSDYGPSIPQVYTMYANTLILFPAPDETTTANIKLYYSKVSTDVSADIDVPSLPLVYHNSLVDYVLWQAYQLDGDWNAAGNMAQKFQGDMNKLKSRNSSTEPNFEFFPTITALYEDSW